MLQFEGSTVPLEMHVAETFPESEYRGSDVNGGPFRPGPMCTVVKPTGRVPWLCQVLTTPLSSYLGTQVPYLSAYQP